MSELKTGAVVHLTNGATAKVKKLLGEGGQGYVYLASVNGKDMALKWYKGEPSSEPDKFYKNLRNNVESGAPSPIFIWPEYVTQHEQGSFGYLMKLRPEGYYEFGKFLNGKKKFSNYLAIFTAAIEICEAFKALHARGLSYQDLNDGNFFINPDTGHVQICDNDNAFPNGEKSGIPGKARYMAPEVVVGKRLPDAYTDKFSLALILFEIIYMNHPFEGSKVVSHPCMTETIEKKCYGSEILFIIDPKDSSNAPVRGLHDNVILLWPAYPKQLRDAFIHEFSAEILQNPTKRMTEQQWLDTLTIVRDQFIICPHCGRETIVNTFEASCQCLECKKTIAINHTLALDKRQIALTDGNLIYLNRDNIPDLKVVHSVKDISALFVQNLMKESIEVQTPSGKIKIVASGDFFPVKPELSLKLKVFENQYKAIIK
jgi:serine/threonine protein kinase